MVVFGQKWLFSGNSNCSWAKSIVIGQNGCIQVKVIVFGQKCLYSGKSRYT